MSVTGLIHSVMVVKGRGWNNHDAVFCVSISQIHCLMFQA